MTQQFLTVVYQVDDDHQLLNQILLSDHDWAAISHSHALRDRDALLKRVAMLEKENSELKLKISEVRDGLGIINRAMGYQYTLTGPELIEDMERYRQQVASTPESARQFLKQLGAIDRHGHVKNLTGE